ncbi:MAG: hypothetical protein HC828_20200 [Blastochloris sp.]|nr:hypothetical protein [Blastochloris sp.]
MVVDPYPLLVDFDYQLFAPFFFLPLLLLLPLGLLVRTRTMLIAVAIPLLLFLFLFGGRFIPHLPVAAASPGGLRLVTFNQLFSNQQVDVVIDALRASEADVIALQELSPTLAAAIEQQLGEQLPISLD